MRRLITIMSIYSEQFYPVPVFTGYGGKIANGTFGGGDGFKIDGGLKGNYYFSIHLQRVRAEFS